MCLFFTIVLGGSTLWHLRKFSHNILNISYLNSCLSSFSFIPASPHSWNSFHISSYYLLDLVRQTQPTLVTPANQVPIVICPWVCGTCNFLLPIEYNKSDAMACHSYNHKIIFHFLKLNLT
jgi:hypothetical protein